MHDRPSLHIVDLRSGDHGPYALTVAAGECVSLSGPSGVGKSRLLRMVADLDPCNGEVRLGATACRAMSAPQWRRKVCYLPAEAGWWADTVREHLPDSDQTQALLAALGLPERLLDAPLTQLSSGERQRLALVRAILQQPDFLLLDEPTSALDEANTLRVEAVLEQLRREGKGLLLVTHSTAQAQRLGGQHWRVQQHGLEAA
ncbi:ABC transporter ATP-binding protein [Chitinimonas sp.]|uniref:ABC transporter ATP-binding protein n=1 Tax=Chitinimonas sp. TaxID=1934313 RepID=UPI002F9465F2